jgi:pyruvate/2-oxoglutarate dehydrogenase complex dihydrolipoamide dehydrogenase (E3) component
MPSKALFEPIDAMHHARFHGWLEVKPKRPNDYLAQIVRWKDDEIAQFRAYRQEEINALASNTFTIIRANASFLSDHEVLSEGRHYTFDAAIIATGSVTVLPKIDGLDPTWPGVWTSDEILHNTLVPKSFMVIGAGAIGLSSPFAMHGLAEVSLVSRKGLQEFPPQFGEQAGRHLSRGRNPCSDSQASHTINRKASGEFVIEIERQESIAPIVTGENPAGDRADGRRWTSRIESGGCGVKRSRAARDRRNDMRVKASSYLCRGRCRRAAHGGASRTSSWNRGRECMQRW